MSDKPEKAERACKEMPLPQRPSSERVVEDIEKWASSSGLQKPK